MERLYDVIKYIELGTHLHIGVLFFGNYGNELCTLPFSHQIHSSPFCTHAKNSTKNGYRRCFACRNLAIEKALRTKLPFGGKCINGIYEYVRPVLINGEVAAVIFIGNIQNDAAPDEKLFGNRLREGRKHNWKPLSSAFGALPLGRKGLTPACRKH